MMNPYWEALSHLQSTSRQYRHDPTYANRQAFYQALEVVKRLEIERSQSIVPEAEIARSGQSFSPPHGNRGRRLPPEHGASQRRMSNIGLGGFIFSLLMIAVLGISLIDKTRQQQFSLVRESTLEFQVTALSLTAQVAEATPETVATPAETLLCGGASRTPRQPGTFIPSLGLTSYTAEQNSVGLLVDAVRALAIDERGIWAGHNQPDNGDSGSTLIQFNRSSWERCGVQLTNLRTINEITFDHAGRVWVATVDFGVFVWDGERWQNFTTRDGLPDNKTYTVMPDADGNIWVGTWQGVAKFDGAQWTVPYSVSQRGTLIDNHVHSLVFHPSGELWVGYIDAGLSRLTPAGEWIHYTAEETPDALLNDHIRALLVDRGGDVWVGTDGGGISRYNFDQQQWQQYTTSIGAIPDNNVHNLALDPKGRVWAAVGGATSYFDGSKWHIYSRVDANAIAFGPACTDCPYGEEHVWLGTRNLGLTHSRLPDVSEVIEVTSVLYPRTVAPGETFSPRIHVRPLPGYQLRDDRGDGLFYTGTDDKNRFDAWPVIPVRGLVDSGETYEFYDYENPFVAPDAPGSYVSTWRVWQGGRLVGPEIRIEFRVVAPDATAEAQPDDVSVTDEPTDS